MTRLPLCVRKHAQKGEVAETGAARHRVFLPQALGADEFVANMKAVKGLAQSATALGKSLELETGNNANLASLGEFLLEGLYVNNRLSKFNSKGKTFFRK